MIALCQYLVVNQRRSDTTSSRSVGRIDDARRENAFGLMMSLNMLIEFGDAFDFTVADLFEWCRQVGFRTMEVIPLAGHASAGVAYK